MEKEKLYHIALDDYEHGVVIRSLNDENKVDGGRQVRRRSRRPACKSRKCPIEKVQSD